MAKPLSIIGLDPGTTIGCVVLGLDGKMIKSFSGKNFSLADLIKEVIEVSQPVLTATDKAKVPSLVEEFSRKLGTVIVKPELDLKVEDKKELVREYKGQFNNDHESDSLASALLAYKRYSSRLAKIKRYLELNPLEEKATEFTRLALLKELPFNIIKDILTKKSVETEIIQPVIKEDKITKTDFLRLYSRWSEMKEEKIKLENKLNLLNQELARIKRDNLYLDKKSSNFNHRVDQLLSFKEERLKIQSKELEKQKEIIRGFSKEIEELYRFMAKIPEHQLLKKLDNFSQNEFNQKNNLLDINVNDFLLVNNPNNFSEEVLKEITEKNIVIVSLTNPGKTIKERFLSTTIFPEEIVFENEHFALVENEVIEKRINQKDFIEKLITEYQRERER